MTKDANLQTSEKEVSSLISHATHLYNNITDLDKQIDHIYLEANQVENFLKALEDYQKDVETLNKIEFYTKVTDFVDSTLKKEEPLAIEKEPIAIVKEPEPYVNIILEEPKGNKEPSQSQKLSDIKNPSDLKELKENVPQESEKPDEFDLVVAGYEIALEKVIEEYKTKFQQLDNVELQRKFEKSLKKVIGEQRKQFQEKALARRKVAAKATSILAKDSKTHKTVTFSLLNQEENQPKTEGSKKLKRQKTKKSSKVQLA